MCIPTRTSECNSHSGKRDEKVFLSNVFYKLPFLGDEVDELEKTELCEVYFKLKTNQKVGTEENIREQEMLHTAESQGN